MNSIFLPIFENMASVNPDIKNLEILSIPSEKLMRTVRVDFYLPPVSEDLLLDVLLINDGQDLAVMQLDVILSRLYKSRSIRPVLCVGIHAGLQRKSEYGTASSADYKGRGNLAGNYSEFIIEELVPAIHSLFPDKLKLRWAFAGFSLGALSALDISWNHGWLFDCAGIFSGSLWWRTLDKDDPEYRDEQHRIIHSQIKNSPVVDGMKFFFECGTEDETEDRNNNGIIDSIDDTMDLIDTLCGKGYDSNSDIRYVQIEGGKHDVQTWGQAMPVFLKWAFEREK